MTYEGFVNSETASVLGGTLSYAYKTKEDGSGDAYTKTSPVGTYYIIPSGQTSANYDITFKAGKLTVSNSPVVIGGDDDASATATIEVSPKEFTYNGKDQKPEVKVVMKADQKVIDSKEYTVTYKKGDTEVSETKDAGTYTVVISNKTGADYAFSGKTTAGYTIKPKALTITAEAKTKVYGDSDPELTYTAEGLVAGDTEDVFSGVMTREKGEEAGTYAIRLGTLSAGDNYTIVFVSANLTITAKDPVTPPAEPTYRITVSPTTGGKIITSMATAKANEQVNLVIKPEENCHLVSLEVKKSGGGSVQTSITTDKDGLVFNYFLMPASDVIVSATFEANKPDQNIFIFKAKYGEVISHVLHADNSQQVNLETRPVKGYEDCVLDQLFVINDKGEQLQLHYIEDPKEGPVHFFFMRGERVMVYNTFKGVNGTVDELQPVPSDNQLYLLNNIPGGFLNSDNGAEGVQLAMSLVANILAKFTPEGELSVKLGEDDVNMAVLNLLKGSKIQLDFTGIISLLNPQMLGLSNGATLTSGHVYELLTPGNLQLLLNSTYSPLLIKSVTVMAPEPEDPTGISGVKADKDAGDTFDLRGRKVDVNTLRKGVYIRDGRKIVIK